ncbi:MAG: hypothetical protein OHK005_08150 [Candidatus Methylacidiphilales bacterium]
MRGRFSDVALALILGLVLAACGSKLTAENLSKIQTGMSEDQVRAILGEPTEIETASFLGFSGTTWKYQQGKNEAQIVFVNGQVFQSRGNLK